MIEREVQSRFLKNRRRLNAFKRKNLPVPKSLWELLLQDDEWLATNLSWWRRNYIAQSQK